MKRGVEQQVFFPDLEVQKAAPEVRYGEEIKISRYLVSNISGKDRYMTSPLSASVALQFIIDPSEIPSRRKLIEINPFQSKSFGPDLEMKTTDVPEKLYELLSSLEAKDKLLEKIKNEVGEGYLVIAQKYFDSVETIGVKTQHSNSSLVLSLQSLSSSFNLEDSRKSKFINISLKLDEVRKGNDQDTVIRIRQNKGRPTSYDAIRLVLDWYAYMAVNKRKDFTPNFPKLKVFNLTDGKLYAWGVIPRMDYDEKENRRILKYPMIFNEVIEAIKFSSLSLKSGFLEENAPNIDPNYLKTHSKKIHIKKNSEAEQILTAKEALEKAQNCLKRINGELPPGYRLYDFSEVK